MKVKILLAAMMTMFISAAFAQKPRPPHPPQPRHQEQLQQVVAYTGKAGNWATNDNYVYDGFYLQTAQDKLLVKFPPHLGAQLTKALEKGSTVTVNGAAVTTPGGEKEIRMISIVAAGKTFYDTPPATQPLPPVESPVTGSGKVTALQKGREGEVKGFILDDKTILRVPPHIAMQLNQLISPGASVSFTGLKKAPHDGEVSSGNYSVVNCHTITVNGKQYVTR